MGEAIPFKGELEMCSLQWRELTQPWRARFSLGYDSLGNLAGMTSLTHDLGGRARKGAVLVLHNPGLLGQGHVTFPSRSYMGHSTENWFWILPTRVTWRESRSHRQRLREEPLVVTCRTQGPIGKSWL